MTIDVVAKASTWRRALVRSPALPVILVLIVIVSLWYVGAVWANWTIVSDGFDRAGESHTMIDVAQATMTQDRPVVPAPHQIIEELYRSTIEIPVTSRRSLVYHAGVTLSATLVGFAIGSLLGIMLAIAIVHLRVVERSLMPWVVASQTVPILALAPIVIVALGAVGLTGLLPKAIIAAYLCFFPVTVGMVKGLNAPDRQSRDLMRTYSASRGSTLLKLRLPSALPYLFVSLKIAVASSLVGTIVGELPTGAEAGLGARLLAGSYYGQTIQIWAALVMAAVLAAVLVKTITLVEALVARATGVRAGAKTA